MKELPGTTCDLSLTIFAGAMVDILLSAEIMKVP
jgi:hypothetical protein